MDSSAKNYNSEADKSDNNYLVNKIWKRQKIKTKKWKYEYKISKGSKTFCGFYVTDDCLGFMIIFGKDERKRVDEIRNQLSNQLLDIYDKTETYHDGKWVMLELNDMSLYEDILKLLLVKSKPNK